MTKPNYTEKMLDELRSFDVITYDDAHEFAETHGISIRSVIAKIRAMELAYQPKPADAPKPTKAKGESKADIVADIQSTLNVTFKGLDKLVLEDLIKLRSIVSK